MSKKKKILISGFIILLLLVIGFSIVIGIKYCKTNDIKKNARSTIECMINSDYSKNFYYISNDKIGIKRYNSRCGDTPNGVPLNESPFLSAKRDLHGGTSSSIGLYGQNRAC